jgi:hypothetical protein
MPFVGDVEKHWPFAHRDRASETIPPVSNRSVLGLMLLGLWQVPSYL